MNQKEMSEAIEALQGQFRDLQDAHNELLTAHEELKKQVTEIGNGKARGPKVDRAMTEADAFRVKFGDHKLPMSHKEAAESLQLSYGQVFSCRGGYTFKQVKATAPFNDDGTPKTEVKDA